MARTPIVYKNANSDGSIKSSNSSSGSSSSGSGGSSASSGGASYQTTTTPPAGSYTAGDKYAGGTTFTRPDGSQYNISGGFTSPSGKTSEIDSSGNITTTNSRDKNQIGTVYSNNGNGNYSSDYKVLGSYSNQYDDMATMQVNALRQAMGSNKDALNKAFDASVGTLNNSVTRGKQDAYIAQQKALKNLPQAMAAAGYTGGITESTAAGLAGDYQNALVALENQKAQELARLQADRAQGIANVDADYQTQIANALQIAQQQAYQREQDAAQLELQQRAAALAEYQARQKVSSGGGSDDNSYTANQVTALYNAGLIDAPTAQQMLGIPVQSPAVATNSAGTGWVAVNGIGRITKSELTNYIQNGKVVAVKNADGSISYRAV